MAAITFLTGSLSRLAGGPFESVRRLAQGVQATGEHSVRVLGVRDARWEDDRAVWSPVDARALAVRGPHRFGYAPALSGEVNASGARLLHVHGLWMYPSVVARRWGARTGLPRVVSPRGMLEPWAWAHHRARKALLWSLFERAHCSGATVLHATSDQEAHSIRTRLPSSRVVVIPNGVDVPSEADLAAAVSGKGERRRALFLSRIHPKKGISQLLTAWAVVRPAGWELAIAGIDEGGHEAEVRRLVSELGLSDSVIFLGEQVGVAKLRTYRSAELFILPTFSENFGIVVAEALAAGVPVLTTTGTPWSGLVTRSAGWWVAPESSAIGSVLKEACALPADTLREMGDRGRAWMVRDFGWPAISTRFSDLYSELLDSLPGTVQPNQFS
jgi:glycosyltransferase involved in cell wall biosynthesis